VARSDVGRLCLMRMRPQRIGRPRGSAGGLCAGDGPEEHDRGQDQETNRRRE
jgi:hypothetical protein